MPHHPSQPKGWMTKKRLKLQVYGLYDYGHDELCLYPHFSFWTHDANLNISFLFCYLRGLRDKGKLGRNLMLQFDNCWRDNKNKHLLAFLSHLSDLHWFESIEVHFLKPGHSHDMFDRICFKPMGRHARSRYGFWTPEEFWLNFVRRCFRSYKQKPTFLDPVIVFDWRSYFDPHVWFSPHFPPSFPPFLLLNFLISHFLPDE